MLTNNTPIQTVTHNLQGLQLIHTKGASIPKASAEYRTPSMDQGQSSSVSNLKLGSWGPQKIE